MEELYVLISEAIVFRFGFANFHKLYSFIEMQFFMLMRTRLNDYRRNHKYV